MLNVRFWIVEHDLDGRPAFWGLREDDFATDPCSSPEEARAELMRAVVEPDSSLGPEMDSLVRNAPVIPGDPRARKRGLKRVVGGEGPYVIVEYDDGSGPFWVVFGPGGHVVLPICHSFEEASEFVRSKIVNNTRAASPNHQ
jgi:hypothetical protein